MLVDTGATRSYVRASLVALLARRGVPMGFHEVSPVTLALGNRTRMQAKREVTLTLTIQPGNHEVDLVCLVCPELLHPIIMGCDHLIGKRATVCHLHGVAGGHLDTPTIGTVRPLFLKRARGGITIIVRCTRATRTRLIQQTWIRCCGT